MAFTAPRTWTDGELVTKAIMDPHVRDNFLAMGPHLIVRKPSDETVSTGTLQDDDHMILPVGVSEVWAYRFVYLVAAAATTDFVLRYNAPTGATLTGISFANVGGTGQGANHYATTFPTGSNTFNTTAATTTDVILVEGVIINGGTGGNLTTQWAGNAAVACIMKTHSALWAVKLA